MQPGRDLEQIFVSDEKHELNHVDQKKLDEALKILLDIENGVVDEHNVNVQNKIEDILELGNKTLFQLKEKMLVKAPDLYSKFVKILSEEEDIELILDSLDSENMIGIQDGESFNNLAETLEEMTHNIREKDSKNEKLKQITERLETIFEKINPEYDINGQKRKQILMNVARTGSDRFSDILGRISNDFKELGDVEKAKLLQHNTKISDNVSFSSRKPEMVFDFLDAGGGWDEEDHEDYGDYDDNMEKGYIQERLERSSEEIRENIKKIDEIMEKQKDIDETVRPIAKLMLFNSLSQNSDISIENVLKKIKNISDQEKESIYVKELPTIGIEIECFEKFLKDEKIDILDFLDIPNRPEGENNTLREVIPDFSYGALTQAAYLQGLVHLGAVYLDSENNKYGKMQESIIYSLHCSYGIPKEVEDVYAKIGEDEFKKKLMSLMDALTYAYASPARVLGANFRKEVLIKIGQQGSKYENEDGSNIELDEKNDVVLPYRVELRSLEFRDYPTYRMLKESQRLVACKFADFKKSDSQSLTEHENRLAEIWSKFEKEYNNILESHAVSEDNLYDKNPERLAELLEETDIKIACRKLITKYSRQVWEVLQKKDKRN